MSVLCLVLALSGPRGHRRSAARHRWWVAIAIAVVATLSAPAAYAAPPDVMPVNRSEDISEMTRWCVPGHDGNLVLVFTVRGSGAPYGGWGNPAAANRLNGQYFGSLGDALKRKGYRVYGFEGTYPALPTNALTDGRLEDFMESAFTWRDVIAAQIRTAADRCPRRRIILAAYSQGGIALRAAITRLPARILPQVRAIDLVADAAAFAEHDVGMPRGRTTRSYVWRRATHGAWYIARNVKNQRLNPVAAALRFAFPRIDRIDGLERIAPYPESLRGRIDQYCHDDDLVCDTEKFLRELERRAGLSAAAFDSGPVRSYLALGLTLHSAYPYRYIALDTADSFASAPAPGGAAVEGGSPSPPIPPVGPGAIDLGRGGVAPHGFWYAVTLRGFPAGSHVTVTCHDSVDPGGFHGFAVTTDGAGNGSSQNGCYSADGPDHWVTANGITSNRVAWSGGGASAPAPTPAPSPPAEPRGFHVEDVYYGGTWARTDPSNGTWHAKANRPANGAYWYPNGLGVAVDCARAAAAYTVRWRDGRVETWNTWFHVTDGKWFPSAATREILTNGHHGLPAC